MATRRYTFKMYPNKAQADALAMINVLHCRLYNAALEQRIWAWRQGVSLSQFDQAKEIKHIRTECPEYMALGADDMNFTLKRLDLAYKSFFKRAKKGAGASSGFPKFKASKLYTGFTARRRKVQGDGKKWAVSVFGVPGMVKMRGKFPRTPEAFKVIDFVHNQGKWEASIVVEIATERQCGTAACGLDWGVKTFATIVSTADAPPRWNADLHRLESEITTKNHGVALVSDADTLVLEGDGRTIYDPSRRHLDADTHGLEGDGRLLGLLTGARADADTLGLPAKVDYKLLCKTHCGIQAMCSGSRDSDVARGCKTLERFIPKPQHIQVPMRENVNGKTLTVPNYGVLKDLQETLKRHQRDLARRKRFSRGWRESKRLIAGVSRKIAARRKHFLHNVTNMIANEFAVVSTEELTVRNMTGSAKGTVDEPGKNVAAKSGLNRAILDASPSAFMQLLRYKMEEGGGIVVDVPTRKVKPSQRCNSCGHTHKTNRKTQAEFKCVKCGHEDNADANAARNMLTWYMEQEATAVAAE